MAGCLGYRVRGLLIGPHRSPADLRNAVQRFLCLNVQFDMIIYDRVAFREGCQTFWCSCPVASR